MAEDVEETGGLCFLEVFYVEDLFSPLAGGFCEVGGSGCGVVGGRWGVGGGEGVC